MYKTVFRLCVQNVRLGVSFIDQVNPLHTMKKYFKKIYIFLGFDQTMVSIKDIIIAWTLASMTVILALTTAILGN